MRNPLLYRCGPLKNVGMGGRQLCTEREAHGWGSGSHAESHHGVLFPCRTGAVQRADRVPSLRCLARRVLQKTAQNIRKHQDTLQARITEAGLRHIASTRKHLNAEKTKLRPTQIREESYRCSEYESPVDDEYKLSNPKFSGMSRSEKIFSRIFGNG